MLLASCGAGDADQTRFGDADTDEESVGPGAISAPTGALVTRWGTDPFSLGSYSYLAVGSSPADRDALGRSVDDRVYFAGEAVSVDYPATVHGALLSGRDAADEIVSTHGTGATVVVVGAGAAGLGAAERLKKAGVDVLIVEGRNRLGGRVHTDSSLGVPVELGAGWIHGDDGNPLSDLAERFGVDRVITDIENIEIYGADGEPVDEDALEAVQEALSDLAGEASDTADLGELIDEALVDADEDEMQLARYVVAAVIEHEEATDYNTLSTETFETGEEFGGDEVVMPSGYLDLLAPLADGVDILLGTTVAYIGYDDVSVEIEYSDGTIIEPDVVLVTVPLGVLKAGSIEFEPELPDAKLAAIQRLGVGVLDRVVLAYDEVFWDKEAVLIGYVAEDPGWFIEWQNLASVTGKPIISAFNAGSAARVVEAMSDDDVVSAATTVLNEIYGE